MLQMKSLKDRRDELCLKFAKKCLRIEKFRKYFPLNIKKQSMSMRSTEKFVNLGQPDTKTLPFHTCCQF